MINKIFIKYLKGLHLIFIAVFVTFFDLWYQVSKCLSENFIHHLVIIVTLNILCIQWLWILYSQSICSTAFSRDSLNVSNCSVWSVSKTYLNLWQLFQNSQKFRKNIHLSQIRKGICNYVHIWSKAAKTSRWIS